MANAQLRLSAEIIGTPVGKSFEISHRDGFGLTEELFQSCVIDSDVEFLRRVLYGFETSELAGHINQGWRGGVPYEIVMGMTEAEALALYADIGDAKLDSDYMLKLQKDEVPMAISHMVCKQFRIKFMPLGKINKTTGNHGYDIKPGGLIRRMQYLIHSAPEFKDEFKNWALTERPVERDQKEEIFQLSIERVIDSLKECFAAKEQYSPRREATGSQNVLLAV